MVLYNIRIYIMLQTTLSIVLLACVLACCTGQSISKYSYVHLISLVRLPSFIKYVFMYFTRIYDTHKTLYTRKLNTSLIKRKRKRTHLIKRLFLFSVLNVVVQYTQTYIDIV